MGSILGQKFTQLLFFRRCSTVLAFLLTLAAVSALQAENSPGGLTITRVDGGLSVENGSIRLEVSDRLALKPWLKDGARWLSVVAAEAWARPAFSIVVGDMPVESFRVDWASLQERPLEDKLGHGRELVLRAVSDSLYEHIYKQVRLAVEVRLAFYDRYPQVVISRAEFTNLSPYILDVDRLTSLRLSLDRRLLEPDEKPWAFASYHGAAYHWGQDYSLVWLTHDFEQRNFMGLNPRPNPEQHGWGTPLIDLWTPRCGLALAGIEPRPEWFSLPVKTDSDGLVEVAFEEEPDAALGQQDSLLPGGSIATLRSALILHRLDYYDPLSTLSGMLRDQGIAIPKESPPQSYEPYWKTWAFKTNFTLDKIYAVLPQLKRIGVRWANLDDGWFTYHGDWEPNPASGKFPGGSADMKAFVKRLHREGFKSSLWWYPQGADPGSRVALEHPELFVRNRDGSLFKGECGDYCFCPVLPASVEYIRTQTRKIMQEWDFDGLYVDFSDLSDTPPCHAPEHGHASPLDGFRGQAGFFKAIFDTAQQIKPGCPVEMCICALPHDPFKMPFYNVASASDPVTLGQTRRRIKVEKALHGPRFCVGDAYQLPIQDWYSDHRPESFESAMGAGAQLTTFFRELTPDQEKLYRKWFGLYDRMGRGTADGEYLNLYDVAFDKPEAHVVRKGDNLYYGFFADVWFRQNAIELRGLSPEVRYRVRDYAHGVDLGVVTAENPRLWINFRESLLLELRPE